MFGVPSAADHRRDDFFGAIDCEAGGEALLWLDRVDSRHPGTLRDGRRNVRARRLVFSYHDPHTEQLRTHTIRDFLGVMDITTREANDPMER